MILCSFSVGTQKLGSVIYDSKLYVLLIVKSCSQPLHWRPERQKSYSMTQENTVSLNLPTFWTLLPEVWLAQAEAQFALPGITADETKYYYVITTLDQPTTTRLLDLISSPSTDEKYGTLKTRLADTSGLSYITGVHLPTSSLFPVRQFKAIHANG